MANQDVSILRELAKQVAEIAALPVQEETRRLWRKLNARCPERPMVNIDQICWNEMNFDGSLTLQCEDPLLRSYEEELRQRLFIWKYLPVDRVVEPFVEVPKLIGGLEHGLRGPDLGVDVKEDLAFNGDATSEVTSHAYINQFKEEGDIGKIKTPKLSYDREQTEYNLARVQEVFDGILDVNLVGFRPNYRVWDILTNLMGVEPVMYDLMDRPEFIHALVQRMLDAHLEILDQLEEQDLLASYQTEIHCTGSYADDLPAPGTENPHPRAKDMWTFGLAQLFSSVSGAMHDEFDLAYGKRWYERFGAVYYGCCDPGPQA